MSGDTAFLCQAFVVGVLITFTYDMLRILRRVIPHGSLLISIEDFVYWLICGILVFLWMYRITNGGMRWYAVAGAGGGIWLYKKFFSEFFVKISAKVLSRILSIFCRVLSLVLRLIRVLGKKIHTMEKCLNRRRRKVKENLKIRLKSYLKALKIRLSKR